MNKARWDIKKFAFWGAVIAAIFTVSNIISFLAEVGVPQMGSPRFFAMLGEILGAIVAGAFLGSIVAVVRNLFAK